jgi:hypothetical protein
MIIAAKVLTRGTRRDQQPGSGESERRLEFGVVLTLQPLSETTANASANRKRDWIHGGRALGSTAKPFRRHLQRREGHISREI